MTASKTKDTRKSWTEAYIRLPWVTRLVEPRKCTGFMGHTPLKAIAVMAVKDENLSPQDLAYKRKFQCKNPAYWKFKGLKPGPRNPFRSDSSGTYCWSHLVSRGIYGDMDEEARTVKWFKKHDREIYNIIRPRWPGMPDDDE